MEQFRTIILLAIFIFLAVINIRNVICHGAGYAMEFNGLPEMPIDRIMLRNIDISARHDATFQNCQNIIRENVRVRLTE